jgi:2-polyprenyl-3-methyl-5-hydroxy-6-metoxy-1,4-benzoquinol methylase
MTGNECELPSLGGRGFVCKLCRSKRLDHLYLLQRFRKNMTPYWAGICADCGLFQDVYDWEEAIRVQRELRLDFDERREVGATSPAWDSEEEIMAARAKARAFASQLDDLGLVRGKRILDVGCGRGFFLHECLSLGAEQASGQEFFREDPIVYAAEELGVRDIRTAGFEDRSAWPDGEFDVVCSFDVIEHLHDLHAFFSDCLRVARPGGVLFHATPGSDSVSNRLGRAAVGQLGGIKPVRTFATSLCNLQPDESHRGRSHVSLLGKRPLRWVESRYPLSVEAAYYTSSYTHSNAHYASVVPGLRALPRPVGAAAFRAVRALVRNKLVFAARIAESATAAAAS